MIIKSITFLQRLYLQFLRGVHFLIQIIFFKSLSPAQFCIQNVSKEISKDIFNKYNRNISASLKITVITSFCYIFLSLKFREKKKKLMLKDDMLKNKDIEWQTKLQILPFRILISSYEEFSLTMLVSKAKGI